MRWLVKALRGLVLVLMAVLAVVIVWLTLVPPDLLRVGTGYAAKIVCSSVYISGRSPDEVLAVDVQAPGHPLLRLVSLRIDAAERSVTAAMLGVLVPSVAIHRDGLGCANVPDEDIEAARLAALPALPGPPAAQGDWPAGETVGPTDPRIAAILADEALTGPGMRAVVVIKDGRLVGEAYGQGFGPRTPLLGWSMTKTVNAAIIGRLVMEGRISLADKALLEEWQGDGRRDITLAQMMAMESGLEFNEDYGDVADVTRMLYLEPDMAAFAAMKPAVAPPGTRFSYSSGTAVLLSRIWMSRFKDRPSALDYPRKALFEPLGMHSAVMEADARGTYVGSSYLYATARDWGRFGQFLLQEGIWNGKRLLPEGFVADLTKPTTASEGAYTGFQAWHVGPRGGDASFGVPDDAYWLQGHDGQTIAVVPSESLVVVRLGLTPSRGGYRPQRMASVLVKALR